MRDYNEPFIIEQGYGYCPWCHKFSYTTKVQDVLEQEYKGIRLYVPIIYNTCSECLEQWQQSKPGDYDELLGLYMVHAKLKSEQGEEGCL